MLGWAVVFFTAAIVAATFSIGGIDDSVAGKARVPQYAFLALATVAAIASMVRAGGWG